MYIPLHNGKENVPYVAIPFQKLFLFTASLPLFAFFSCVVLTMLKDFETANRTHCKVPNIFPSVSAAIGVYEPQGFIWRVGIYFHAPARFLTVYLRWKNYQEVIKPSVILLLTIAVILNLVENMALVGLTYWNSSQFYPYHEKCFKTFIGTSLFYMLLLCILFTYFRRSQKLSAREDRSLKLKWRCFVLNAMSFAVAAYCFLRHNRLCEPYVYSVFAFAEYIVVLTNILFHMTTIYDFHRQYVIITRDGIYLR